VSIAWLAVRDWGWRLLETSGDTMEFVEFLESVGFPWRCGGDIVETVRDSWRQAEIGWRFVEVRDWG
jgi:hypothetical protein